MPSRPKLVKPADTPTYATWDQYVTEATKDIKPFVLPLPDGTTVEVPCPDGDAMEALGEAQRTGDDTAAYVALLGPEVAPVILLATAKLPFFVRAKIVTDIMKHYGQQIETLGD